MNPSKSLNRIHISGSLAAHGECVLPPRQSHHVVRVLRLGQGESIILFNGDGAEYAATIARVAENEVTVRWAKRHAVDREPPHAIMLAQALSGGERMDYTVQKAVELGVAAIQPLAAQRSVVRLHAERAAKRVEHWQAIAIAACEQCGRNRVPQVLPLSPFDGFVAGRAAQRGEALRVLLTPHSTRGLRGLGQPAGAIVLLAGPEGGFTPEEERIAEHSGFIPVRLGPRVLRTETAAVAALAAVQALWGDF